ncbi:MAG: hypothetical protein FWD57_10500, partial [Polyangiaceae bacterium]|nr:hypothetical protein [Polyangiaceae bacterium]
DASHAREQARMAREAATATARKTVIMRDRVRELHSEVILWEGRCAFDEPHSMLAEAYRNIADAVDPWVVSRILDEEAEQKAKDLEVEVADLEYQIGELRAGLLRLEASFEQERETSEQRAINLGREAESLENELLSLATTFCVPLRERPDMVSLFKQLESGNLDASTPSISSSIN